MASMTMAAVAGASLLPTNMAKTHAKSGKRGFTSVVAKAAAGPSNAASMELKTKEESSNGRRELVFAAVAAAAAACSFAKVAMADEPERGSPEAKKKYAPICVTMPTARICRK